MLQEQQDLHYELHKNIALQRRVSIRQSDRLEEANEKIEELEKKLEGAQGLFPIAPFLCQPSDLCCLQNFLWTSATSSLPP
jgi:hypothetical protein